MFVRLLDSGRQAWNNGDVKKKPTSNSFPYFFGSVILIVAAIVVTAILNRTTSEKPQDVRARASVTSLMRMTAIVETIDETKGVIVVNGLQFSGSTPEGMQSAARNTGGSWNVSVSGSVNLSPISPGSRVELQVNPSSFNIADRTLTAAAITLTR